MSSITFFTATGQNAFNVATTVGNPVWEDVIPELNAKLVFNQEYMQTAASYAPLALNTQYPAQGTEGVPATPTFYLVGEFGHSDEKAGLIKWTRQYARVPDSWSDTESYAYNYPAYLAAITIGTSTALGVISAFSSTTMYYLATAPTAAVGDQIYIATSYVRGGATYAIQMYATVRYYGGGAIGVGRIFPGTGDDFQQVSGTVKLLLPARFAPRTLIVGSRIQNDYALATPETLESVLPIVNQFQPIDSTGNEAAILSIGTATSPNSAEYQKWMASGAELVAEPSPRERWRGNIYVRKTRLVPAK